MAKPLQRPPPSSSIARLLDADAAARAIATATPEPAASPITESVSTAGPSTRMERFERPTTFKREVVLTGLTDDTLTRLVELYRRATGTRLSTSHVVRMMLRGVAHCMDSVEREAGRIGRRKLPANATGHEAARERFEHRLAQAFVNGMRAAASLDVDES